MSMIGNTWEEQTSPNQLLTQESLIAEVASLRQELAQVKQEKSALQTILINTRILSEQINILLPHESLNAESQRSDQEMQEAKEQLQAVLNAVPGPVSWVDSSGKYLGVNQHLASEYDLSPEAFVGQEIGFLEGGSEFSEFVKKFFAQPDSGATQVVEMTFKGAKKYYLIATQKYQHGNAIVSVGIDMTERKLTEQALQQSEARNKAFLNAIPDLILRISKKGIYLDVKGAKELHRFTGQDNCIGQSIFDILPLSLANQYIHYIQQAIQTGETQEFEYQVEITEYQEILEARVVSSGLDEVILIVRDITDRKLAEDALRIAEENYRSIFENALEGIFQSSPEGRFLRVNPTLAKIYGYDSPEEMISSITNIGEQLYVDPEKRTEFRELLAKQEMVKSFEYRCFCKDGNIIWTQIDARAVKDSNGKLLYYEGIVEDITQRKRREDELRLKLEELKIEIDHKKRKKEVAMLTETTYFQEIQQEMSAIDLDEFWS